MAESYAQWLRRTQLEEAERQEEARIRGSQIYYMMNPTPWERRRRAFYRFAWAVYLRIVWAMVVLVLGVWMGLIAMAIIRGEFG